MKLNKSDQNRGRTGILAAELCRAFCWQFKSWHSFEGELPSKLHHQHPAVALRKRMFPFPYYQIEIHLARNRKENCRYDHIPFNVKGNGNISFLSVVEMAV